MGLLLATALAAQIHTGADLLQACEARVSACEAFIQRTINRNEGAQCFVAGEARLLVIHELRATRDKSARADLIVSNLLSGECSAAD